MKKKEDEIFIYPTDTVWGIGCSIYSQKGYNRVAEIKKSAEGKPLSVMFADVEILFNSFYFPKEMTLDWLVDFFKLETTLGLPLESSKIKIPRWATGQSDFVTIRLLKTDISKKIYQEIKNPFFSTSLNFSGEAPIVSQEEALKFKNTYAPDAHFFTTKENCDLSGQSSTIVFFTENLNFEIKREGLKIVEVTKHITKLFPK